MPALKAAILAKYWLKWLKFWNKPSISLMSFIPVSSWTAYLDHIRYKSIFSTTENCWRQCYIKKQPFLVKNWLKWLKFEKSPLISPFNYPCEQLHCLFGPYSVNKGAEASFWKSSVCTIYFDLNMQIPFFFNTSISTVFVVTSEKSQRNG